MMTCCVLVFMVLCIIRISRYSIENGLIVIKEFIFITMYKIKPKNIIKFEPTTFRTHALTRDMNFGLMDYLEVEFLNNDKPKRIYIKPEDSELLIMKLNKMISDDSIMGYIKRPLFKCYLMLALYLLGSILFAIFVDSLNNKILNSTIVIPVFYGFMIAFGYARLFNFLYRKTYQDYYKNLDKYAIRN